MVSAEFESILEKYNKAKIKTYKVLELLGTDYTFNDYGADVINKHYQQLLNCGTVLTFAKEEVNGKKIYHLTHSNFCRQRICPMCQFRKSEKTFAEMLKVVEHLDEKGYRFLHLVLTIPNARGGRELIEGIKKLYKGFSRFLRKKQIERAFKGCLRCLEISYNYDNDTFHPHLHCLIAVNKSYFNDSKTYLSYDKIKQLWADSCGLDTTQGIFYQVFVRAMKQGDRVGVAEVCKYCVKPLDLESNDSFERETQNINVLLTLSHTLKGTRFLQKYGCVKDTYNELFRNNNDDDLCEELNSEGMKKHTLFWNTNTMRYGVG